MWITRAVSLGASKGEFEIPHIWTSCMQWADPFHLQVWLISMDKLWTELRQMWPVNILTMYCLYVSTTVVSLLNIILSLPGLQ